MPVGGCDGWIAGSREWEEAAAMDGSWLATPPSVPSRQAKSRGHIRLALAARGLVRRGQGKLSLDSFSWKQAAMCSRGLGPVGVVPCFGPSGCTKGGKFHLIT
jgi:hypothetical protein